ncbi:hypothetical protein SAY86_014421 [Trapa natans]|uniref:Uncharacterized protein n=1 Tax=Trapa natans TaxID=22666 RepID=A0AAN7KTB9_TRANT|nr:hypothetical protein SAY86_014421 [Trapa natans]
MLEVPFAKRLAFWDSAGDTVEDAGYFFFCDDNRLAGNTGFWTLYGVQVMPPDDGLFSARKK